MKYKYGIMGCEFYKSLKKQYPSLPCGTSGIVDGLYDFQDKPFVQIDWGISGNAKQGWVDIAVILNKNIRLGVQLENGKYRRFICGIGKSTKKIAKSLKNKGAFFKNNYEKFKSFGDKFRYQELQAVDAPKIIEADGKIISGKTYKEILEYIKQDLKTAIMCRFKI
jgi:hypothetical protein